MLTAGTKLGPYEILSPLGAGGMGEVYRARDTKLGRDMALKRLPPSLASDPERLEGFIREAQMTSALNHPHIVTLYDVVETSAGHCIVMEFVQGRTLRVMIAERPTAQQVISIGLQVARARCRPRGRPRASRYQT